MFPIEKQMNALILSINILGFNAGKIDAFGSSSGSVKKEMQEWTMRWRGWQR